MQSSVIRRGYTTYLTDKNKFSLVDLDSPNKEVDVSYRAKSLSLVYGSLGLEKASIASHFI